MLGMIPCIEQPIEFLSYWNSAACFFVVTGVDLGFMFWLVAVPISAWDVSSSVLSSCRLVLSAASAGWPLGEMVALGALGTGFPRE